MPSQKFKNRSHKLNEGWLERHPDQKTSLYYCPTCEQLYHKPNEISEFGKKVFFKDSMCYGCSQQLSSNQEMIEDGIRIKKFLLVFVMSILLISTFVYILTIVSIEQLYQLYQFFHSLVPPIHPYLRIVLHVTLLAVSSAIAFFGLLLFMVIGRSVFDWIVDGKSFWPKG